MSLDDEAPRGRAYANEGWVGLGRHIHRPAELPLAIPLTSPRHVAISSSSDGLSNCRPPQTTILGAILSGPGKRVAGRKEEQESADLRFTWLE